MDPKKEKLDEIHWAIKSLKENRGLNGGKKIICLVADESSALKGQVPNTFKAIQVRVTEL